MAESIGEALAGRAADDNIGLVFEDQSWTWREVVAECAARAAVLSGYAPGNHRSGPSGRPLHLGVLLENVPEFVFLLGGAALAGAVVVGINPTRRGAELARDIRHTDCDVVVTDRASVPLLDGIDLSCPIWLTEKTAYGSAGLPVRLPGADALFCLIFTSGSTGAPKAVQMSQGRAFRTGALGAVAFGPGDVLYCAMPLFHGNALFANLFPAIISGAAVALRPKFSASEFMADVRKHHATYFNYVGRALSYILAQPESADDADNDLKYCLGSEASPADRKAFRKRFGCYVVEGYSSSEGGVVIQPFSGMPPNALGKPADGVDVVVLNAETGEECARGCFDDRGRLLNPLESIGEIVGRDGLRSFEGYYGNPMATAERGRNGWYWTGDLAYRSEDGTFFFAGRTSDWLRVDGENFAAGPVEAVLCRFDGVRGVVVYPVPDPRTGDLVMAALELTKPFDPDAFDAFLVEQPDLGTKWAPRFVRVVDAIPLTATGKVDRQPLRAQRWENDDDMWWRLTPRDTYRRFTADDAEALREEFATHGRTGMLT